jgi:RimJ/RimL family protein N-acetyltransferase
MKYIGNGRTTKPADVASVLRRVAQVYQLYPGLGTWRAARRDTGAYIGWFTLKYIPGTVEVEVGYRLLHEAWGRGFATEGATALVQYGFDDLGLDRIIGITHKDNLASQRVLTKAGLKSRGWGTYYGWRVRLFEALRNTALTPALSRAAGEGAHLPRPAQRGEGRGEGQRSPRAPRAGRGPG